MFAPLEMALLKIWIWDSGTSQHSSHDCGLFTEFTSLINQSPVQMLGIEVSPQGVGSISVSCKGKDGQLAYLCLEKVLFTPGSGVNLMSQGQLQREGCPLVIVSEGIEIGWQKILARLVNNNLYISDLADSIFPPIASAAINPDPLELCHPELEHLENVLQLAIMSKIIDLSKPPPIINPPTSPSTIRTSMSPAPQMDSDFFLHRRFHHLLQLHLPQCLRLPSEIIPLLCD